MRRVIGRIENGKYAGESATAAQRESFQQALAQRRPPALHGTDAINFRGQASGDPFPGLIGPLKEQYLREARAMGIEPNGKVYKHSLVRTEYAGRFDPEALVDSTGDIKRTVESRGWGAEGMVNVEAPEVEQVDFDKPVPVADDLVEEHLVNELESQNVGTITKKEFLSLKEKKRAQLQGAID